MLTHRYDELTYAKEIHENGFQSTFIKYELVVLVKYLKLIGYSKKETEIELYSFCKNHIQGFNEVKYYKVIDGAIRDGRKENNPLIVVKSIPVYISELEYIDNIDIEHEYKKLLLSFYIKKKISLAIHLLSNKNAEISLYVSGNRKNSKDIFESSKIVGKYKFDNMVNHLIEKELVDLVYNGDIILKYASGINVCENDEVYYSLSNNEFDCCGYVFDLYKGVNKVKKCSTCGKIIKCNGRKDNSKKYCTDCSKISNVEKTRERVRRYREKNKTSENSILPRTINYKSNEN